MIGSIVVPAHNEAGVIGRTIDHLFDGLDADAVEVVVVCNGCTDDTADIVRGLGRPVRVLELADGNKSAALQAGDDASTAFPRLYLDADVELGGGSAAAVLNALTGTRPAARPPAVFDTAGSSWPVRRFYAVRSDIATLAADLCGAGVYGLSRTGRARFGPFPPLAGDDLFVARLFADDEVEIVPCAPAVVRVPRTVRSLVKTLGRVYRGNRELLAAHPEVRSTTATTGAGLRRLLGDPRRWIDVANYVTLVVLGRIASVRPTPAWARDETTRPSRELSA